MTTKFTKTFVAALAAAVIGVASLSAPAMAAGQISVSYTPTDPDEAQADPLRQIVHAEQHA